MNDKILVPLLLFLFVFSNGFSQTKRQYLKHANESFAQENYYAAMKYYGEVLEFDSTQAEVWYKMGESAEAFYAYSLAEESYNKVLSLPGAAEFPLTKLRLAEVQKSMGKYSDAIRYYQDVLADSSITNADIKLKATLGLDQAEWAFGITSNPDTNVVINNLGEEVNSPYSEFAPTKVGDKLFYTSFRFDNPNDKNDPPRQYNKVMQSEDMGMAMSWDGFNSKMRHTAHSVFSKKDTNRIYFTYCDYVNEADIRCEIYYRDRDTSGWLKPVKLPVNINVAGFNNTNPELAEVNGEEHLFFSSDKPGGKGGMDLYFTKVKKNGKFSSPINIKELNTEGDDITPYFHSSTNTLYFSNNTRQGLGGHDIFEVNLSNSGEWGTPKHMGYPLNSSYDDIHYKPSRGGTSAYFASNRLGSIFLEREKESCCHDIYSLETQKMELLVNVFEKFSDRPLSGATVTLTRLKSGDLVESLTNDSGNDFAFTPQRRYAYLLKADKPEYISDLDTVYLDREPLIDVASITRNMHLEVAQVMLTVLTFDDYSKEGLVGTQVQLFELIGGERRLVETKNNPDGNDFEFAMKPGKTYIIRGSKSGYEHDLDTIQVPQILNVGSFERELYLAPLIFAKYLPISLYFDNDYPDPNTRSIVTNKSYLETWDNYIVKEGEFIDGFGEGMQGQMKQLAGQRLSGFFAKEVKKGGRDLKTFTDLLYEFLKQGNNLEIVLRGYTSPRAESDYNDMLSKRRIVSVKNHFQRYNGGILGEFIRSGKLVILERPYGETQSKSDVSDKLEDVRNSIFGVPASLERRVEIIDVKQAEDFQRGTR